MYEEKLIQEEKKKKFWNWFIQHNEEFLALDDLNKQRREELLDNLLNELHSYHPQLYFQIGGNKQSGIKEMIISAEGNIDYFVAAEELAKAAPQLPNWK